MVTKKEELEMLIEAWKNQADRGNLSEKGLEYLSGLEKAYEILFPIQILGVNGENG